jgi:hypothetical protein
LKDEVEGYEEGKYWNNLLLVLKHLDPNDSSDFKNWEDIDNVQANVNDVQANVNDEQDIVDKCVCSHKITWVSTARHKITRDTISVGNVCIGKFSAELKANAERRIRTYKGKANGDKYCGICETKVNKKVVDKFPNMDTHYHMKCLKSIFPKCDICDKYHSYDCECIRCETKDCGIKIAKPLYGIQPTVCYGCYKRKFPLCHTCNKRVGCDCKPCETHGCKEKFNILSPLHECLCQTCYNRKYPMCGTCRERTDCDCKPCKHCPTKIPQGEDICRNCIYEQKKADLQAQYLLYKKKISDMYKNQVDTKMMTLIVKYNSQDKYGSHNFTATETIDDTTFKLCSKLFVNIKKKYPDSYSPVYRKSVDSKYITFRCSKYNFNFKEEAIYKLSVAPFKKEKLNGDPYVVFHCRSRPVLMAEADIGEALEGLEM